MIRTLPVEIPLGFAKPSVDYLRDAMGGWIGDLRDTRSVARVVA